MTLLVWVVACTSNPVSIRTIPPAEGGRAPASAPQVAAACYLEAALAAPQPLAAPPPPLAFDARRALLGQLYGHALASFLVATAREAPPAHWGQARGLGRELTVEVIAGPGAWPTDFFDWIRRAFRSRGLLCRATNQIRR